MALPLVFCSSTVNPKSFLAYPNLTSLANKNNSSNSIMFSSVSPIRVKNYFLHFPCYSRTRTYFSPSNYQDLNEDEEEDLVQDLRVPSHWLTPSNALQESEWLKVVLHKWLDDEYCVEDTNVEISEVAAKSYYESLVVRKEADLGMILLQMARDLESISYQESFHGAFSSANAAIQLISQRIEQQ
ncbi:hypothetical protein C5167_020879 [Papaver somniferum]|uniref:Uncharacterized protein n=1 Tax=Papaver somniferum TaxID=3469 RepID=A0A4Y7IXG8_PAPSO|nr:uncharacterized protein LOC113354363 [Papaver somniferum]RZC52441.1 hypothetical protein C5167_020879 [Papaver somniferum]